MRTHRASPLDTDVLRLVDLLQSEYVGMYGEPDPNPHGGLDYDGGTVVLTDEDYGPFAIAGWSPRGGGVACLRRMYVHYAHRGEGHSRFLLTLVEEDARARGQWRMTLETGVTQTAAIALYRSAGYEPCEPFGYYAGQDTSLFLGRDL